MRDQAYPLGVDYTWLAADSEGRVLAFVTGGEGPIPRSAVNMGEAYFDQVDTLLEKLPIKSHLLSFESESLASYYSDVARRGVYIFDWSDVHKTKGELHASYELLAAPDVLLYISDINSDFKKVLETFLVGKCISSEDTYLNVENYFDCLKGSN